jgi:hypothetical protein
MTDDEAIDFEDLVAKELATETTLPEAVKLAMLERARTMRVRRR